MRDVPYHEAWDVDVTLAIGTRPEFPCCAWSHGFSSKPGSPMEGGGGGVLFWGGCQADVLRPQGHPGLWLTFCHEKTALEGLHQQDGEWLKAAEQSQTKLK